MKDQGTVFDLPHVAHALNDLKNAVLQAQQERDDADERARLAIVRADIVQRERDDAIKRAETTEKEWGKASANFTSLLRQVETLKNERDRLRDEILRRGWWRESGRPCPICGYEGAGYYQPTHHACARLAEVLENEPI